VTPQASLALAQTYAQAGRNRKEAPPNELRSLLHYEAEQES